MKRSTRVLVAGFAAVSMATLAACGAGGGAENGGAIRLATGVDVSYAPVYVAAEKGYFEDRGVDVDYSTLEGGPAMVQAVVAGQADVGTQSDATTITMMGTDPKLRAFADFGHSDTYIKVVWGSNVKAPGDIKKMATLPGLMTLATVRYLESKGIDPDSVEIVSATPPDIPVMLKRGDVDGTVVYEPWATRAAEEGDGKVVGTIGDFGVNYSQWLISNETWLKDNPEDAKNLAAAINDANNFITANPDEAADIVLKAVKIPKDQTLKVFEDLVFETRDLEPNDVTRGTEVAQFFVDTDVMKSMPNLNEQLVTGFNGAYGS